MRRILLPLLIPLFLIGLMFTALPYLASASLTTDDPPLPTQAPVPPPPLTATATPVLPGGGITDVISGIRGSEYHITWQSPTNLPNLPGAYQAPNRAHNFRTYFTPTDVRMIRRTEETPTWQWGMSLATFGYEGQLFPLSSADLVVEANRIEYRRAVGSLPPGQSTPVLVEWYENDPDGIEQGFTLNAAPPNRPEGQSLQLNLNVTGSLTPRLVENGKALTFLSEDGVVLIRYDQFYAYDATGAVLSTAFELHQEGDLTRGVRLRIDDRNALYPLTIDPLLTAPTWTANDDQLYTDFGWSVNSAGDVNDDGYDDVLVGAPRYDNGQTDEGRVYLFHGSAVGVEATAAWMGEGNQSAAHYGYAVAPAGDVNDDGYDDIVIGAPQYGITTTGRAFVYLGSAGGITTTGMWTQDGTDSEAQYGFAVASAGDVNDDGYADIIVGSPYASPSAKKEGQAFAYLGSSSGLTTTAIWQMDGGQEFGHFGWSVAQAGDVNGDDYSDVLIGAPYYEDGETDEGWVYAYLGMSTGISTTAGWVAEANQPDARFGYSVSGAGDVNNDGYADIIVGSPFYTSGQSAEGHAFAWYGSSSGLGSNGTPGNADWSYASNMTNASLGWSVAGAGDINADGYDDIVVGAPYVTDTTSEQGKVYLFDGSAGGIEAFPAWTELGTDEESWFGYSVASAGNVNGDEFADLIIGAYGHGFSGFFGVTGMATVYPGIGVSVTTDSPTVLGNPTTMTATVTAGTLFTYTWDFGDGLTGTGQVLSHTYAAVGVYTVTVTGTEYSTVVTTTAQVTVQEPISGVVALSSSPTILSDPTFFTATVTTGTTPVFTWGFGDGITGTGAFLSHTYPAVGTYTATVTATNAVSTLTDSVSVIVSEPISGLQAFNDSPTPLGLATTLSATVTAGSNVDYTWDFGDGTSDTGAALNHTYLTSGTFTATVTATNEVSLLTDTTIVVLDETLVGLGITTNSPKPVGGVVTLTATLTSGDPATYLWDFGNGITGTGEIAYHLYADDGTYTAIVTASNLINVLTATANIEIGDLTIPSAPTALSVRGRTSRGVLLTWSPATDDVAVMDYIIYSGTTELGTSGNTEHALFYLTPNTTYTFSVRARDGAGNISESSSALQVATLSDTGTPPTIDPSDPDPTIVSDIYWDTRFLYTESPLVQVGMDPSTILQARVAVLRGIVSDVNGDPLPGVKITVHDHPEYGQTWTQANGAFDLVVNGGTAYVLEYSIGGYLSAQRKLEAPVRDYTIFPDIVLIEVDTNYTAVNLDGDSPLIIHDASVITDNSGERHAAVLFPEDVTATFRLADGTVEEVTSLTVRATEFTVGDTGASAMPGDLPSASAYTYAFELSVDEADPHTVRSVEFSQPLVNYVENFLEFPVGLDVPTGYFDRALGEWVASEDGRIIQIVSIAAGKVNLDVDGDGDSDTDDTNEYPNLQITDAERTALASQVTAGVYTADQELWRVLIPHFTPWDHNYPYGPPEDAVVPNLPEPTSDAEEVEYSCQVPGSIISCENQTLGERLSIAGTPLNLMYNSGRTEGNWGANTIHVPIISGTLGSLPASILGVQIEVSVAGHQYSVISYTTELTDNEIFVLVWDGTDIYGRPVQGEVDAHIRVGYMYPLVYYNTPEGLDRSFGRLGSAPISGGGVLGPGPFTVWQESTIKVGRLQSVGQGFGGWQFDIYHTLDTVAGIVYRGDGTRQDARFAVQTYQGTQQIETLYRSPRLPNGNALEWPFDFAYSYGQMAIAPDGTLYVVDQQRIWRIEEGGERIAIAGTGNYCDSVDEPCGEDIPALESDMDPNMLAFGPDGTLYFCEWSYGYIRQITADGTVSTFMEEHPDFAFLCSNYDSSLVVGTDGTLYFTYIDSSIYRTVTDINGDISIERFAGQGYPGFNVETGNPLSVTLYDPHGIALEPGLYGDILYVADNRNHRIRKIEPDATGVYTLTTIAGTNAVCSYPTASCGNGGAATAAPLYYPDEIAVSPSGEVFIAEGDGDIQGRIRRIDTNEIINAYAGTGIYSAPDKVYEDGAVAISNTTTSILGIRVAPNGTLYWLDGNTYRVRKVEADGLGVNRVYTVAGTGPAVGKIGATLNEVLFRNITDVDRDEAGNLFITDQVANQVLKVDVDERVSVVAGNGFARYGGDGSLAIMAQLHTPRVTALAPDGTVYILEVNLTFGEPRVRAVGPDGVITTIIGKNAPASVTTIPYATDPMLGLAKDIYLCSPTDIEVGPDGSLYVSDLGAARVYRIDPSGNAHLIAGYSSYTIGTNGDCTQAMPPNGAGENIPAIEASVQPRALGVDRHANVYILENMISLGARIRRVSSDGIITRYAGSNNTAGHVSGIPALLYYFLSPETLTATPDGDLYVGGHYDITYIGTNQVATIIAGTHVSGETDADGLAIETVLTSPAGLSVGEDGYLYIVSGGGTRIRRIEAPTLYVGTGNALVPSSNGRELYEFNDQGRHLNTYDALNGVVLHSFGYDSNDLLASVTVVGDATPTTIERDSFGVPTAVVSPYNQTTTLTLTNGYLTAIQNPAQETTRFTYTLDGLLENMVTPRNEVYTYTYNSSGRLIRDENPVAGYKALQRYHRGGVTVELTNALGDEATFYNRVFRSGISFRRIEGPNGFTSWSKTSVDGSTTLTVRGEAPDVVLSTTTTYAPDPRWGMASPYISETLTRDPGGEIIYDESRSRDITLTDPEDPLSLVVLTDVVTINGRSTTQVYDRDSRTLTITEPSGKVSVTTFDVLGRPVLVTRTDRASITYEYGVRGQLTKITEGTRITEMTYDSVTGYLLSIEDPEGGITSYVRDAVGRVLTETLPTLHSLGYAYDLNGNLAYFTDTRNVVTHYQYDAHDRLITTTVDVGNPVVGHRNVVSVNTYDLADNLTTRRSDVGTGRVNLVARYDYVAIDASLNYLVATMTDTANQPTSYSYTPLGKVEGVTNARGYTTAYTYTEEGWLGQLQTPDGVTTYQYYGASTPAKVGMLRQVIDPRGVATKYDYDTATGRLVSVTEGVTTVEGLPAVNQVTTYAYNVHGQILTSTQGSVPNITVLGYDAFGRLGSVRNGVNHTATYAYDDMDRLLEATIGADVVTDSMTIAYQYDLSGRLLNQRVDPDGLNLTTRYYYTATGSTDTWSLQRIEDPRANTTQLVYDTLGYISTTLDTAGQPWQSRYDNVGRLTLTRDPLNKTALYQYDAMGRVYSVTDTLGYSTGYRYDEVGNLIQLIESVTLSDTRTTDYFYDPMNRVRRVENAEDEPVIYTYDEAGNLTGVMDALSQTTSYTYDSANRFHTTIDEQTYATVYGYDPAGRVVTVVQTGVVSDTGDNITTTLGYDGAGQLTTVQDGLERDSTVVYDAVGRVKQRVDANGIVTAYEYDRAGRLEAVIENYAPPYIATSERNVRTEYTYDANGNLLTVTDALENVVRTYTYDERNMPLTYRDALNNTTSMAYTNRGELRSVTDALSQMTVYTYTNLIGQVQTIGRPDETVNFDYDPLRRLETMVDGVGTTTFAYDIMDRITSVEDPFSQVVDYDYNAVGNLESLVMSTAYSSGTQAVQYLYDDLNRLTTVTDWGSQVTEYAYDPFGRLETATAPNEVVSRYTYDKAHQIDTITHEDNLNAVLGSFDYTYDAVGNRTGVVEVMNVTTATTTTIAYEYDDLYRLTDATYSDGRSFEYVYDAVGNRTMVTDSFNISTTYVYSDNYTIAETIVGGVSQPYTWDDNGNLLSDGVNTYTYDSANRLIGLSEIGGTDVYTYTYNGMGYRVGQAMTGTVTADINYLLNLNTALPEVLADGDNLYLYGIGRIGEQAVSGGAWEYHQGDALGSVRLVTGALGQAVQGTNYDPNGNVLDVVSVGPGGESAFGFTGEQTDPTGMVYLRARYYNPNQAQFLTKDPFGGINTRPNTLHPYGYVGNNPLRYTDPSGLCWPNCIPWQGDIFAQTGQALIAGGTAILATAEGALTAVGTALAPVVTVGGAVAVGGGILLGGGVYCVFLNPELCEHVANSTQIIIEHEMRTKWGISTFDLIDPNEVGLGTHQGGNTPPPVVIPPILPFPGNPPAEFTDPTPVGGSVREETFWDYICTIVPYQDTPSFENQLPWDLPVEVGRAERLGVKPVGFGTPEFDDILNSDETKLKWAVTEDGQIKFVPHTVVNPRTGRTVEINHPVITGGAPVIAAGEAEIIGSDGVYIGLELNNNSGHYLPSNDSLDIAREIFANLGVTFPDDGIIHMAP